MSIILAKEAEAGRRYRCVDNGTIIEICSKGTDKTSGKLIPLTNKDGTWIHVNAISNLTRRLPNLDGRDPLVIPAFYKLEPYDGPYVEAPKHRKVAPRPTAPKTNRAGRRPKAGNIPWMGWAVGFRYDLERLLEVMEEEGFWIVETFHYFRVGYQSQTCLGIFKSGYIGFHGRPEGLLGSFPTLKPKADLYLPWKINLKPVMSAQKWTEMTAMLQRYLRHFKSKVERQQRHR